MNQRANRRKTRHGSKLGWMNVQWQVTEQMLDNAMLKDVNAVRRQGFWNRWQLKLRESLAHLVGLIMRRAVCDASVAFRAFFV